MGCFGLVLGSGRLYVRARTYFPVHYLSSRKGGHADARQPYSCGLDAAVDVVGGQWKPLILWELHAGVRRFGELRRGVSGSTEKMLIQQRTDSATGETHSLLNPG